jgi:hypothetical protein
MLNKPGLPRALQFRGSKGHIPGEGLSKGRQRPEGRAFKSHSRVAASDWDQQVCLTLGRFK